MLSSTEFRRFVPTRRRDNLAWRVRWLERTAADPEARAAVLEACKRDIHFYVNGWAWAFDPRRVNAEVGPFIFWPFQGRVVEKILDHIERGEDLLGEKSRDVGWTWVVVRCFDWLARFRENKNFVVISHTEKAVDDPANPNSIFWKFDFVQKCLPGWFPGVDRKKLSITYPATGSYVTGAATTERAAVGGRVTAVLMDEFALQKDAEKIWSNTADVGCRIVVSTHYGVGTKFNKLAQGPRPKKVVTHWTEHPEKARGLYHYDKSHGRLKVLDPDYEYPADFEFVRTGLPTGGPRPGVRSPWYDEEDVRRQSKVEMAMHVDIDVQGSGHQFFDAARIDELRRECRPPVWRGDVHYDKDTGQFLGLLEHENGPLSLWVNPTPDGRLPAAVYGAGADLSNGRGVTPSCVEFVSDQGEQVGEYVTRTLDEKELAPVAVALCWLFSSPDGQGAAFAWEMPGPGLAFADVVMRLGYRNVYFRPTDPLDLQKKVTGKPGWHATPQNKRPVMTDFRFAVQTRLLRVNSDALLAECLDFVVDPQGVPDHGGRVDPDDPNGSGVNHGDRVWAGALAWLMAKDYQAGRPGKKPDGPPPNSLAGRRLSAENRRRQEESALWPY